MPSFSDLKESLPTYEEIKSYTADLYDAEKRPELVLDGLTKIGAPEILHKVGFNGSADKVLTTLAAMSTVAGLKEKKDQVVEIAAPYIAKAREGPEARAELASELAEMQIVQDGKAILNEKVVEPVSAKISEGKAFAAPYLASAKEVADPYVAKLTEIRNSEKVEAMIAAFQDAREHPADKVGELRAKAVDLIKYDNLVKYREHVMSAEFQADTIQLVKVDLPAIAASAAKRGAEGVKAKASVLKEEMDKYSEKLSTFVPKDAEEVKAVAEKVKVAGAALLVELQAEIASGVEHVKSEGFTMTDAVDRLKRVVGIVEKMVVAPIIEKMAPAEEGAPSGDSPPTVPPSEAATEEMHDALEEPEDE